MMVQSVDEYFNAYFYFIKKVIHTTLANAIVIDWVGIVI